MGVRWYRDDAPVLGGSASDARCVEEGDNFSMPASAQRGADSKQLHTMVVGSLGERHGVVDSCYRVVVPFWTNPFKLNPSEELIGPLTPSPKKDKQATTWRDDAKQVEKRAANSGAKAPAAKKKPKTNSGDRFDALDIDHNASEI